MITQQDRPWERAKARQALAASMSDNECVQNAIVNVLLWIAWHPGDYQNALEFGALQLDDGDEDEFEAACKKMAKKEGEQT